MDDAMTKAQDILSADPLPDDAEAQIDALIEGLPQAQRAVVAPRLHEALEVARQAQAGHALGSQELSF